MNKTQEVSLSYQNNYFILLSRQLIQKPHFAALVQEFLFFEDLQLYLLFSCCLRGQEKRDYIVILTWKGLNKSLLKFIVSLTHF